ncbi:MAG: hypothetical protein EA427_15380 [Spirochaetaceae bacterium]|nr:MAG: hypothetical protein EA427_15380 [Spirochaetaceae bacterium]
MVRKTRPIRFAVLPALILSLFSCDLWNTPDTTEGRATAPKREILVVHSLAETLSSVELAPDGSFLGGTGDIVRLGSVPNGIIDVGYELAVTLSGENRVLFLDRERLFRRAPLDLGTGVNPMQTRAFGPGASVFATTGLFSARVHLRGRDGTVLVPDAEMQTGLSPQAILPLPGSGGGTAGTGTVRLVVANTAYSAGRPADIPFGPATLTVFTLTLSGTAAAPQVSLDSSKLVELEESDHNPETESGLNPVALLDMNTIDPAINEILVIGSGINYGSGGSGADDGTLLVLDRTTLEVKQRIPLGGSPGAAIVMERDDGGLVLLMAGTDGIRSLRSAPGEPAGTNGWDPSTLATEYTATGGLPFLADIVSWGDQVYVADFGNNQVLRFTFNGDVASGAPGNLLDGPLERRNVSDGPVALLVRSD